MRRGAGGRDGGLRRFSLVGGPALPAAWPACAVLLPHARAVLGLTSEGPWRIQLIADADDEDEAWAPSTWTP